MSEFENRFSQDPFPQNISIPEGIKKHDEEIVSRRRAMVSNIREPCNEKGITEQLLTLKLLQKLMNENSDKFFGVKTASGLLATYFLNTLSTLKELTFKIPSLEESNSKE